MKVDLGIWSKLTRATVLLLVLAGLLAISVAVCRWYLPVIQQNERMRKEILRLDTRIQEEEQLARKLTASIQAISNDPKVVERLARERLGYAKPGETVVHFEPRATNTMAPARSR